MTTQLNAFEALSNALFIRHNAELIARNGEETADTKAIINHLHKYAPEALNKGFQMVCNWQNKTPEEVASRFTLTDKKSVNFINLKGTVKFLSLLNFIATKENKMDNFLNAVLKVALEKLTRGQVGINKNGVTGSNMSQQEIKESISYRAGLTNEQIDYLIEIGRADFLDSTWVTQSSQIKCMLITVGLCSGVKKQTSNLTFNGAFIRYINGLKGLLKGEIVSRGYNGEFAIK